MKFLEFFSSEEQLTNHREVSLKINGEQTTKMHAKGSNVQFTGHHKQLKAPFVLYSSFESSVNEVQKNYR